MRPATLGYGAFLLLALAVPALGIYPVLAMQLLCFAMFACAFNLLLGFACFRSDTRRTSALPPTSPAG